MSVFYLMMMLIGSVFVLSSSSWALVWTGLEINMISYIGFVGVSGKLCSESLMSYFIVQVIGSLMVFFIGLGGLGSFSFFGGCFSGVEVIIMFLCMKMGVSPLHYWFPVVLGGLGWSGVMILLSWQKVAVLGLIMMMGGDFVFIFGLISVMIGGLGGFNQLMLRSLLAYSSISHMGWMMILISYSELIVTFYFIFYVILSLVFVMVVSFTGVVYLGQFGFFSLNQGSMFVMIFLMMLSLGGMPPLLGFFPKWVGLLSMVYVGSLWVMIYVLMVGLISLFYYVRVGYGVLLMFSGLALWQDFMMSEFESIWFFVSLSVYSLVLMMILFL